MAGLPLAELAELAGTTPNNVKTLMAAGRRREESATPAG